MKIHRSAPVVDGITIPTATLLDERLSFVARGLLCELLTRPDDWEANADEMSRRARDARGLVTGEGRQAMRAAFAELESHGYLVRRRKRYANGRFVTTLELYDTPGHALPDVVPTKKSLKPTPRGEVLYRHWDENGLLLYVGVTNRATSRERAHAKVSPWMEFWVETTYEQHPSRASVEAAEAAAILDEQPLFNVAGNDDPEAPRRLRRYLAERNRLDLLLPKVPA
ncbi:hypothetical protein FH608_045885 [Nonomuraea phyllanthi]|uniref:GIY-YIG nuclease family protein n=1 Tax=Nonomuraea phyllanthi TaxID=2219224 RepID=A0A5C4V5R7_9ACTN|nr:hypothetical protein [Nonomuraea phyllanthi]KAB8186828.1 hypothetical protein FH608_045885 [Nonomuraea phyllanthi]